MTTGSSPYPDGYEPQRGRASAVVVLLWVGIGFNALSVVSNWFLSSILDAMARGESMGLSDSMLAIGASVISLLGVLTFLGTAIAVCIWLHGAVKRQHFLDESYVAVTPAAAVWSFFIPFVNLARPYTVVRDLLNASRYHVPLAADENPWKPEGAARFVGAWWACWLIGNISGQISWQVSGSSLSAQAGALYIDMFSDILHVGAAFLLIRIVRAIDSNQDDNARRQASTRLPQPEGLGPVIA